MVIVMIERYVNGKFDEGELVYFWRYLLTRPEYLELLETYLMLREYTREETALEYSIQ